MSYKRRLLVARIVPSLVAVMVVFAPITPAFAIGEDEAMPTVPAEVSEELVENQSVSDPVAPEPADITPQVIEEEEKPGSTGANESEAPASSGSSGNGSPPALSGSSDPPYTSVQPVPSSYQTRPDVDQSTGALTYRYPFSLPPGRNGMTPDLSLSYNSQDRRDGSSVGYGWSLSIPSIDRQNLAGLATYYSDEFFTSGLSGELVRVAPGDVPNNFSARIDDGSFVRYTFTGSGGTSWVATTKNGTRYTFGATSTSRLFDTGNDPTGTKVAKWLLDSIEDTNGNRINFSYFRDLNQLYPDTITYTNTAAGTGPFLVMFIRELRPETDRFINISYANDFRVETRYRVREIQVKMSGTLVARYSLGYSASSTNNRSLLTSITETGYDAGGSPVVLPATTFAYTVGSLSFALANPNPFTTVAQIATSSLRHGFLISDVNGDGYADLVRSWKRTGSNDDQRIWLNDREGSLVENTTWGNISATSPICFEDPATLKCASRGVVVTDKTGDLFADYYHAEGGSSELWPNIGIGWGSKIIGSAYSLAGTYTYRPSVAPFDGANPSYTQEVEVGGSYATDAKFGNRVADVNHDGLPDAVRSTGSIPNTNGLDEGIFLNTGINPGGSVQFDQENNWLFLNGTSIGANAASANAIFEHTSFKEAFMTDMNGDDLPDVLTGGKTLYRHNGNTWVLDSTPITSTDPHEETQVADFNGDGLLDLVASDNCEFLPAACIIRVFYNTSVTPDFLQTITLPAGGTISASYKASPLYEDENGNLLNPALPTIIQTVERITETDPVIGIVGTTFYEYAGGRYFFKSMTDRRFTGFEKVTRTMPDGSKNISYFTVSEEGKMGKSYRTDLLDAAGASVKQVLTGWTATTLPSLGNSRFFTVPDATVTIDFGTGGAHRDRASRTTYDTGTGALIEQIEYGEVAADVATSSPVFTDIGTDMRRSVYTYATGNNLELPGTQTVLDASGNTVSQTRTYYDNLPLGQVVLGNRTKAEQLMDVSASTYAATQWTYDPMGLVASETDPLNHTTQYVYDSLNLYPVTVTNALTQQTTYTYDYTNGKPVAIIDPNGEVHTTVYDGVDRVSGEWRPHPSTGVAVLTRTVTYTDLPSQAAVHDQSMSQGSGITNTHSLDLEDSSSQYLSAPDTPSLSITSDMTIELWAKLESQPTSGNSFTLMAKYLPAGGISYLFDYENYGGVPRFRMITSANGTATSFASVNHTLTSDTWHHVALVYTASVGNVQFFVDGVSIGTGNGLATSIFDGTAALTLGARNDPGPTPTAFFDGLIDDVRVWNVARTNVQIDAGKEIRIDSASNLQGSWHFDNLLIDESGNGNTLINNGSATFVTDVPYGTGSSPVIIAPDTHTYFDGFGRPIQQRVRAEGTGAGGLPLYVATDTNYDSEGRVEIISLPYASPGAARTQSVTNPLMTTAYAYDAAGRVVSVTDALGVTATTYDIWDTAVTNPNGNVKKFSKDAFGELVRVEEFLTPNSTPFITSYEWSTAGNLTRVTDSAGNVRNFTYDARGLRLTGEDLHASGDNTFGTYSFTYDSVGNLVEKITPKNETITYTYDALHRMTSEDFLGAAGTEVAYGYDTCTHGIGRRCSESKTNFSRSLTYDFAGNAATETATIDSVPYATSYAYDQLGTVIGTTHPDGSATIYALNESGKTETVSWQASGAAPTPVVANIDYAPSGALSTIAHANGLEETFVYDANAKYRLTEHVVGSPGSGGSQGGENTHSLDLEDSSSQYLSAPDTPSLSVTGDMTIELWAKLESQPTSGNHFTLAAETLPPANTSYLFDYKNESGVFKLRLVTSANGSASSVVSVDHTLPTSTWTHIAFVYTAGAGGVQFFVNGASVGTGNGLGTSIFDGSANFLIGARYDAGPTASAFFDGLIDDVRVWKVARTNVQIDANRWITIDSAPNLVGSWHLESTLLDASGNGNTLTNPNSASFVTDVPFGGGGGTPPLPALSRRQYTYDPVGNILSVVEMQSGATTTSAYSYDGLDRLTQAVVTTETGSGTTQTTSAYAYDSIGNITLVTENGIAIPYVYAGNLGSSYANPHAATSIGSLNLTYDKNGNLASRSDRVSHNWNYQGRLTKVTLPDRETVTFRYDPQGTRVSMKSSATATTTYATQFWNVLGATTTVHLFAGGAPVATVEAVGATPPKLFASHGDHLRSTALVTDDGGLIAESARYAPFGKIVENTGVHREQRKFTGHEYDAESSYTYAKARYLDTNFGRFLSQDPAFVAVGDEQLLKSKTGLSLEAYLVDPQLANSYSYARNNPIKFTDPTGEFIFLAPLLIYAVPAITAAAAFVGSYPVIAGMIGNAAMQNPAQTGARMAPISGDIIDATEAFTGRDAFSREQLSAGDRLVSGASAILPFVSGGVVRSARSGVQSVQDATKIAGKIANGHAFTAHVQGIGNKLGMEYGSLFRSQSEFAGYIENVMNSPSEVRHLNNGRIAFWDNNLGSVVLYDPGNVDLGTTFRPINGKSYFEQLK